LLRVRAAAPDASPRRFPRRPSGVARQVRPVEQRVPRLRRMPRPAASRVALRASPARPGRRRAEASGSASASSVRPAAGRGIRLRLRVGSPRVRVVLCTQLRNGGCARGRGARNSVDQGRLPTRDS